MSSHGRRQARQFSELSCTVAKFVDPDSDFVEQRHMKVRQWRALGIDEVPSPLDCSSASTDNDRGQRTMGVPIAVAQAGTVQDYRVVEERPFTIWRRPQ